MNLKNSLLKETFMYTATDAVSKALSFILLPFVSFYLVPDELGIATKATAEELPVKKEKAAPAKVRAWMVDSPAAPLSNILSGIALKDRGIFINTLFREDPQLFIDTIGELNAMGNFAQAQTYIEQKFPEWNLDSDAVYRLMMAVRRKLN